MTELFEPLRMKSWDLPHRIMLAPMTRSRAAADGMVPTDLTAEYYAQRASAALIVTEGTQPSAVGQGYLTTPGIHSPEQVEGWRKVADAVHARDGRIFMQLMHAGRVAHADNKGGLESVAPSAIRAPGEMFTAGGMKPMDLPARSPPTRSPRWSRSSPRPRATRSRPASTASRCTAPTAT